MPLGSNFLVHSLIVAAGAFGGLYEHSGYDFALALREPAEGRTPGRLRLALAKMISSDEILFGEDASLLRFGPEGISAISVMAVGNAAPQEVLGYVVSGSVAPGEIVSLYGVGLGPQTGAGAEFDSTGKISAKLAGTQVFFDGVAVPLLYAGTNQINAVVPFAAGDRPTTTLTVQTPAGSSSSTVLKIVAADPALPGVFDTYSAPIFPWSSIRTGA